PRVPGSWQYRENLAVLPALVATEGEGLSSTQQREPLGDDDWDPDESSGDRSREPDRPGQAGDEQAQHAEQPPQRWGFGAFLLVEATRLASAAFVSVLLGADAPGGSIPIRDVLIGTMAPVLLAAGLALVITKVRGNGPFSDLKLEWRWDDVRTGLRYG